MRERPVRQAASRWAREQHGLSFYDAVYLELAIRHSAPMATLDRTLARAADAEGLPLICGPPL